MYAFFPRRDRRGYRDLSAISAEQASRCTLSSIPRNALRLRLEPPPSNVAAVWDNGDVLFFARYEELLNTSSGYAPETMGEDECIGMLELDEKLYSAQAHYINALTGDYREMPYGYVYLPMPRSKENIALNGEAWWLDV